MATIGNNLKKEYADLRDAFLTPSEREYFERITRNDPFDRQLHCKLMKENVNKLYNLAKSTIEKAERGEFNDRQMWRAEYVIYHCLSAIEDIEMAQEHELNSKDVLSKNKTDENELCR